MQPPPAAPHPRRRWDVIYYLLAAFNILTVSGSLYLNTRVTDMYVQAVATNQEWGQLLADYAALEQLIGQINAAGNDVFQTRDVAAESKRIGAALPAFRERVAALRQDMLATVPSADAQALLQRLRDIEDKTTKMAAEGATVLALFDRAERDAAAQHMAAMDQQYATLLRDTREMRARFAEARSPRPVRTYEPEPGSAGAREPRWQRFERQTSAAASLQRWEFVIGLLIVGMVSGAVIYGRNIAAAMERDAAAEARYVRELNEARETLERRVLERTDALRRSEESLRLAAAEWQQTFEAIDAPVLQLDADGRVLRANPAALAEAHRSAEEAAGCPVESLGPADPWRAAARLVRQAWESGGTSTEVRDEGSGRTWDVSVNVAGEPGAPGSRSVMVARDVTRIVDLQDAVRREETMSAMGSLVAGVAHEARNPLFGISATLDAFHARFGGDDAFQKYFTVLKRDVGRLQTLMEDLLEYGRPAQLQRAPTSLEDVIADAVRACEPLAKGLLIRVDLPRGLALVDGDEPRLVQVFQNLIQNALQHTPAGGQVVIEAGPTASAASPGVWCGVRDAGPGFREVDLSKLFEPFFTRRQGGTGLGLSIAQRIVERHGGTIRAANHPAGGAVVTVTLPLATA